MNHPSNGNVHHFPHAVTTSGDALDYLGLLIDQERAGVDVYDDRSFIVLVHNNQRLRELAETALDLLDVDLLVDAPGFVRGDADQLRRIIPHLDRAKVVTPLASRAVGR